MIHRFTLPKSIRILSAALILTLLTPLSGSFAQDLNTDEQRERAQTSIAELRTARQSYLDTVVRNEQQIADPTVMALIITEKRAYTLKALSAMINFLHLINHQIRELPVIPNELKEGGVNLLGENHAWFDEEFRTLNESTTIEDAVLVTRISAINQRWTTTTRQLEQINTSFRIYQLEFRLEQLDTLRSSIESRFQNDQELYTTAQLAQLNSNIERLRELSGQISNAISRAKDAYADAVEDDIDNDDKKASFQKALQSLSSGEESLTSATKLLKSITANP